MNSFLKICIILTLALSSCNSGDQKTERSNTDELLQNEIKFEWQGFELDGIKYEHGAMFLPVYIDSIDREFKMQLDLGLNVSAIYENPLQTILSAHPHLKRKIVARSDYEILRVNTSIGNYSSSVDTLFIYKDYGDQKSYDSLSVIGSIGANEVENKILLIDFPNTTITILNDESKFDKSDYRLAPLEYKYGKIFISLAVDGQSYDFIYDTGASISAITTIDKAFFDKVKSNSTPTDTVKLNSWGTLATFEKSIIESPIELGEMKLSANKNILFTQEQKIVETLNQVGIDGLVGNDFFIDNVIVIDLVNNKFGVKKQ
ncbi:hypothetical protein JYB62_15190 [Algoriphagus lutimaris]|uniref:hypothetical protein n=1 Tax=Algoriphagus lutimaris TaxID=613197 RepID=UPI00196A34D4|nr:hypothetical protein [Algoriphagus lutimaris]MBN3521354.1 hypothetical protein [Algoriphagus lutimaris]